MRRERAGIQTLRQAVLQAGVMPGLLVIGFVIFLRLLGLLQPLEWWALDYFLRLRPAEPTDEQILIVGIDEQDIQALKTYPVPDDQLAELIEQLQTYQPRAIGIDIVRDQPVPPGHNRFAQVLQKYDNVFGIEKALPDAGGNRVKPPPSLPPERVGFADLIEDSDGALRRALIGTQTDAGYKFSLPLLLSERYLGLETPPLAMENGLQDPEAIRFGEQELTRFRSNTGSYVNADARGNQFLINYRSGTKPFRVVSLRDVIQGKVSPDWIHDRLILVGMTATSVGDIKQTNGVNDFGTIYGVEAHAHIASQIIQSTLNNRPWINTWQDEWEYIWIAGWGILGISLGRFLVSPLKILLGAGLAGCLLVGASFGALITGWWLGAVPALLVLGFNSLMTALFYRHQQELQSRLRERQLVIDQIYTAIHNVPVQTLASILRAVREGQSVQQADLERLEQELRIIEETAREAITQTEDRHLCGSTRLNLQHPLRDLLYEVYRATLTRSRDFPSFATVIKLPQFDDIESRRLTIQQKQGLCRFLEEALCNAGKYAEGMTRLEVSCKTVEGWTILRVADNGVGLTSQTTAGGYGTRQASRLARQLGGRFQRTRNLPKGTVCELVYPVQPRFWFRR